jgi:hypothetical protein
MASKPLDGQIWQLAWTNPTTGLTYRVLGYHYAGHWFGTQRIDAGRVLYRNILRGYTPIRFIGESL